MWGQGSGSIWMDNVDCTGNELSLFDCSFTESHDCSHGEDVAVECDYTNVYMQSS